MKCWVQCWIVRPGLKTSLFSSSQQDIKFGEDVICQQYVSKPFLIDGFKFDLRIYALVTSCDPLRIFLYQDGLARFATVKYTEPLNSNVVSSLHYYLHACQPWNIVPKRLLETQLLERL